MNGMIVREILTDTEKVIETFDFFNDYDDTKRWIFNRIHISSRILEVSFKLAEKYGWWLAKEHNRENK